ncbi:MAG: hypothetical protein KAI83_04865 [Thiomargarita sp.]|nr:hypothetical protein [Thiomargarita sp.]
MFTRAGAMPLSQGEHAGSPLQPQNTWGFVGADLCVCPSLNGSAPARGNKKK